MKKHLLVVGLVAACGAVLKPPDPDRRLSLNTSGTVFESSAGYRFAVLPDPDARIVRLDVRYPVGSIDDPPGKAGLAHLVEHLLFDMEITRKDASTSISAELNRLSLYWNAETAHDYTTFQTISSPEALDEIIGLEVDRLVKGCGGLTPAIFTHEREVVLEELRERQGAAGAELSRALYEAVYPPGHPYRAVDSVETVAALDFKDVCDFLAGPYRRGKAIIVASGAVTEATLRAAVDHHFGRLHPRQPATRAAIPLAVATPGLVKVHGDVDAPILVATWPLPPVGTHDSNLLELATGSIAFRMETFAFVYGWGYSAHTTILGGDAAPVLAVSISLSSANKVDDAIEASGKAIEFAKRLLGPETNSRAWQETWHGETESLLARWDNLTSRNQMMADTLAAGTADAVLITRVKELAETSPGEVKELVDRWLDRKRARYILIEPSHGALGNARREHPPGAEERPTAVDPALADQPLPVPSLEPLQTIRFKLDNGLSVILWPHGTVPLVYGRLVVGAGTALDPTDAEGVASLEGAGEVFADHIVYGGRELATKVDELIHGLTNELRFPGYELSDTEKDYRKGRLRARRAKERLDYVRSLAAAIYGPGHPYARREMTEDSIDHIHTDMTLGWARRYVVPTNSTLIVAGQFDPELVRKHIMYDAAHVSAGDRPAELHTQVGPIATSHVTGVTTAPTPTVELDVAFRSDGGIDRNFAARLVLEQVLDARLSQLRAKQALTYGFSAAFEPRRAGGLWLISGDADATRAAEAATALRQILDDLSQQPGSYRAEFVLARQKVLETLVDAGTSSATVAADLDLMARFDLPDNFFSQLADVVSGLTIGDFQVFVKRELAPANEVRGVFGNRAAVDAVDGVFATPAP